MYDSCKILLISKNVLVHEIRCLRKKKSPIFYSFLQHDSSLIPGEVEARIARYFIHMYLPAEITWEVEDKLLPPCIWLDDIELDHDELVRWALEIIY